MKALRDRNLKSDKLLLCGKSHTMWLAVTARALLSDKMFAM